MDQHEDSGRLWLGLSTTTEIAMAITLNKYSAVLPDYAVLLIWLVPLVLLVIWLIKEEKSKAFLRHFRETPIAYCFMVIVFVVMLIFTTTIVRAKVFVAAKIVKTAPLDAAKAVPTPPATTPSPQPVAPPVHRQPSLPKIKSVPETKPEPPVVIGGNVDQSGDGCQQKIIGGSNNTQNCVPQPRKVDSEKVGKAVSGAPGILFVLWEDGTPDGLRVARQLSTALQQQWRQGATLMKMGDPEAFPFGVTLSTSPESSEEVKAAVDSLKKALTAQGVECGSITKEGATVNVVWVAVAGR